MWNGQCASADNQMSVNAQEDDEHHSMQVTQLNLHTSDTRKKYHDVFAIILRIFVASNNNNFF